MVRTSHHCKYNINYHIIWIPKYRKLILVGKVREVLKTIIDGQCQELSINNLALEIMPDHLHLFVGAKPTVTPFKIIHKLKGNTSIQLNRFSHLLLNVTLDLLLRNVTGRAAVISSCPESIKTFPKCCLYPKYFKSGNTRLN